MKKYISFIVLVLLFHWSNFAVAENEIQIQMFTAVQQGDLGTFNQLLSSGADPGFTEEHKSFRNSSFCEATKVGNGKFFDLIVGKERQLEYRSFYTDPFGSPLLCAISYGNFPVYEKLLSLGVEVNAIQNEGSEMVRRPLSFALLNSRANFAWDILQRIEPDETQITYMVQFAERNGGVEGTLQQMYRQKIIHWLIDRGVLVDPKPPAPRELYERKK